MESGKAHSEHHEISFVTGEVGQEKLDSHIRDDHNNPHRVTWEDIDPNQKVTKSTWAAVFFLGFTFQPSLSFTILMVFPILVPIAIELQGNTHNVNWMLSGWSLAGSIAFAIAGQTSDYFGRRHILLFGQALLILGHIIGCTANSVNQGIAAMVILGFGTGTTFVMYPGTSELLPNKYRSIGLAWTELNLLPFATFGPLFSRLLLTNVTWRWVFYLGIISAVISFVGTAIFYIPPSKPFADRTRTQVLRELDYIGILLYTAGLTLFLLGLGWGGGVSYTWKSAAVLVPLILGALLFVATFFYDSSGQAKRPLFPKRLLGNVREYTILLVLIFVTGFVYFSLTDLIPEQIGYMFTTEADKVGLDNIPGKFGGAAGGVILGALIAKLKKVHWQLFVGIFFQTLFTALFALITPDTIPMALVFQCLTNLPFAWITLACYVTASLHVPQRDLGLALGLIGTTVFTTILNNKSAVSIPRRVHPPPRLGHPGPAQLPPLPIQRSHHRHRRRHHRHPAQYIAAGHRYRVPCGLVGLQRCVQDYVVG